jgi:V/A-type H+/Na+-transporting ATPase subunit I
MLLPMARVQIVGLRPDLEAVLATIHGLGVLELTPLAPARPLDAPTVRTAAVDREQLTGVEAVVERLGALLSAVSPTAPPTLGEPTLAASRSTADMVREASGLLATLEPVSQRCTGRRAALEAELASLRYYQDIVQRLLPLAERLVELEGFETVALVIQPNYRFVVDTLREELAAITQRQCELVTTESPDGSIAALLVFSRRFGPEVHGLLYGEQLTEVRLPPQYRGRPFRETLLEIARREQEIPREIEAVQRELEEALLPYQQQVAAARAALLDRLDELAAVGQCLASDYTFALGGWVPVRDLPALEEALSQGFGGRVVVERLPVGRADWAQAPVLLENPRLVRPFEVLSAAAAAVRDPRSDAFRGLFLPLLLRSHPG